MMNVALIEIKQILPILYGAVLNFYQSHRSEFEEMSTRELLIHTLWLYVSEHMTIESLIEDSFGTDFLDKLRFTDIIHDMSHKAMIDEELFPAIADFFIDTDVRKKPIRIQVDVRHTVLILRRW